jgi:pimeloyl-ACP methyl ester carboxylesterase
VACSQELIEGIPDAQLEIFEESGHDPFREESDKFAELVGGWINQDNE